MSGGVFAAHAAPQGENRWAMTLMVGGVHCPACIQKIESALQAQGDVTQARLNYTTKRLKVAWTGDAARADALADVIARLGYRVDPFDPARLESSDEEHARFLRLCLGVSGFASGNIMLLSFALWTTDVQVMGMAMREFFNLMSALIGVPTVAFAGRPFFRSATAALAKGRTNMDVPISIALVLTTGMSLMELFRGAEHVWFDSAVMLMFFLLIGRYLDFIALSGARRAAGDLISMMGGSATILEDGRQKTILIRDLREGMTTMVAAGERIPADGIIVAGESAIDTALVTGESVPVPVRAGSEVLSGTMNMSAPLTIRIARAAEDSMLANVIRLMEKAEQGQARYVRVADRAARLYTPVVHTLALAAFLGWTLLGGMAWQDAMMIAVTVLIITCPCALGLAVPVVQVLTIGRLMRRGIMVKTGDALERLARIDTVMLDKTGTLTMGAPCLMTDPPAPAADMQLAASMAARSRHPLARAMTAAYEGPLLDIEVRELAGLGLEAEWQGEQVRLGSRAWCGDGHAADPGEYQEVWLARGHATPVPFRFSDTLRPDAQDVVARLQRQGMRVVLVSGDRAAAVERIAAALGIADWHAGKKPEGKFAMLEALKAEGRKVLMVGDGLNDAPVLAGADASISPAAGIDIARNAADVVFTGARLEPVLTVLDAGGFSQKLVVQNFVLAIIYNILSIPLAVAGYVTPMVAAIAMSSSSVLVIANAFRMRRRV